MPRDPDREDFMTDYDPRWGNDDEREWDTDDEPGADPGPDEDDE